MESSSGQDHKGPCPHAKYTSLYPVQDGGIIRVLEQKNHIKD